MPKSLGGIAASVVVVAMLFGIARWLPRLDIPSRFWQSEIRQVHLDDQALRLVVGNFGNGLRDVPSLGALDGMLFVFETDTTAAFGMERVLIPLDVAWFDEGHRLIAVESMATCSGSSCAEHVSPRPFRYVIETSAGRLINVAPDTLLVE
jgi:uncharacterized membrane protein (UPF0127 family)